MTPPAPGAVPHDWDIDHDCPSDFVVRCRECGRVSIRDGRANAHRQAQSHALRCSQTGVTPVSRPDDDVSNGFDDETGPSLLLEGVDPTSEESLGMEIAVRYESISSRAGSQRVTGLVESLLDAESEPDHAIEVCTDDDRRLRINVVDGIVLCQGREMRDGGTQWRTIGDVEVIRPARLGESSGESAVATDGGER